jgi:hypothetical protein
MDKQQVIKWVVAAAARGVAWFLAGKLGVDATQSGELGTSIAEALPALAVAGIAIYSSVRGRRRLLETQNG